MANGLAVLTLFCDHNCDPAAVASSAVVEGVKTVHDRRVEGLVQERAKELYQAEGWRTRRGGWVADFGPKHTHAWNMGEEDYTSTDILGIKPWHRIAKTEAVYSDLDTSLKSKKYVTTPPATGTGKLTSTMRSDLEERDQIATAVTVDVEVVETNDLS